MGRIPWVRRQWRRIRCPARPRIGSESRHGRKNGSVGVVMGVGSGRPEILGVAWWRKTARERKGEGRDGKREMGCGE